MLDAAFQSEHDVEIAQTDVGIDEHHARAALRERRAEVRRRGRLSDAAFARRNDDRAAGRDGARAVATATGNRFSLLHELPCFQCADETSEETLAVEVGERHDLAFQSARDLIVDRRQAIAFA